MKASSTIPGRHWASIARPSGAPIAGKLRGMPANPKFSFEKSIIEIDFGNTAAGLRAECAWK